MLFCMENGDSFCAWACLYCSGIFQVRFMRGEIERVCWSVPSYGTHLVPEAWLNVGTPKAASQGPSKQTLLSTSSGNIWGAFYVWFYFKFMSISSVFLGIANGKYLGALKDSGWHADWFSRIIFQKESSLAFSIYRYRLLSENNNSLFPYILKTIS